MMFLAGFIVGSFAGGIAIGFLAASKVNTDYLDGYENGYTKFMQELNKLETN